MKNNKIMMKNGMKFWHGVLTMLTGLSLLLVIACEDTEPVTESDMETEETTEQSPEQTTENTADQTTDETADGGDEPSNDVSVLAKYFYSDDVTVEVEENTLIITTKDLPDHKSMYWETSNALYANYNEPNNPDFKKNPGNIGAQNIVMTIPRFPEKGSSHPSPGLGPMGVAINSVVFFNQQAGPGDDIFEEENTFDQYEGHPAGDQYHYHVEPIWLTENKGSDAFLGFLLDGFPVYGPMEDGKEITNNDLDDYHGHTSATEDFPEGIYHYHITEEYPWINGDGYYGTPGTKTE